MLHVIIWLYIYIYVQYSRKKIFINSFMMFILISNLTDTLLAIVIAHMFMRNFVYIIYCTNIN